MFSGLGSLVKKSLNSATAKENGVPAEENTFPAISAGKMKMVLNIFNPLSTNMGVMG